MPDDEFGERVAAFLELRDANAGEPTIAELHSVIGDQLAKYKWPREAHVVAALPRNALGKVTKGELKKAYAATNNADNQ